ncbi:MAG: polyprenyl synthetase family protein, partial [Anaerolineales bacterium]
MHKLSSDLPNILALPLVACQSVGGIFSDAIPLASAWSMLRYAADIIDAVQDEDDLPNIVNDPSMAIGFANGLIFSAFDSISTMNNPKLVREVVTFLSRTAFQASYGQHLSLQRNGWNDITLESYWHATILKSGSIFRAGLGGGAIVGNAPDNYITALDGFGNALGVIRQIIDDCRDVFEKTEIGAYEITLPLLILGLRREESVDEL